MELFLKLTGLLAFLAGLNISFISMKSLNIIGNVCQGRKYEGIINQQHKLCVCGLQFKILTMFTV